LNTFCYLHTVGEDAGVDVVHEELETTPLATVLELGLPPFRISMEVAAMLCAIVDIAAEDGETHGDIGVDHVFMTADGSVGISGFGKQRRKSRTPEGSPRGKRTDLYGLGKVIFS
jgi:hypothetical protein